MTPLGRAREARGQALPIMVLAMTTLLLAVAVTIDGGNAFQQQRAVQNGSDGAALAGAVKLGNYAACNVWSCTPPTDADVRGAIDAAAAANAIDITNAYYTDVCGTPLQTDGSSALTNGGNLNNPAQVGGGVIPPHAGGSANCVTGGVGPTAGVLVFGHRSAPTFIAGMIGINTFEIETQATAVATYGTCASSQGCALLPIAFPVDITTCDANKDAVNAGRGQWQLNVVYKIPLCQNNPGNVGWLDWDPKGGGTSDVVAAIARPDNSPITFPSWQFVSEPGNKQSNQLESALRLLGGETVRTVQFDHMCGDDQPDSSQPIIDDPARWYGCTQAQFEQGNGSNLWYRLPRMLGFVMCEPSIGECFIDGVAMYDAYMGGGQGDPECESASNGAVACIVGKFVDLGNAGFGGSGDSSPVQLIR